MRALLCRLASICLLLGGAPELEARADTPPRVIVVAPAPRAAVVERALLLIRGELAGEGLSAEIRAEEPPTTPVAVGVYGVLWLDAGGSTTVIRAFAPGDPRPIVANVDAGDAGVDAEVVAVRAVETLRAAVLQFAQAHRDGLPEAVRGFAQLPKATPPAEHPPSPPPTLPRPRVATGQAFIGPELAWQPHLSPSVGARAGLSVGPRWGFVAAGFESTLYRSKISADAGHAELSRQVVFLELGARFQWASVWEVTTRAGAGYAHYAVAGTPTPGYLGLELDHESMLASLGVGGAYYFGHTLGAYLNFGGSVALDAPNVRIADQAEATLDRPSFAVSSGLLVAVF